MKKLCLILHFVLFICAVPQSSWASKAYVTDTFEITLRTGPSVGNKIVAMPSSGQPVEILETQGEWSLVRVLDEDSKEGWVVTRYLLTRQPWEMQAKALKQKNAALRERLSLTESKLAEMAQQARELKAELRGTDKSLLELQGEYQLLKRGAEGYLSLKKTYEKAKAKLDFTREEARRLAEENLELRSSQMNRWFATGALVLLCGLMIGVIVGKQQKRRRSIYD